MSILDNNKKKRDQKSSETEKELALAQLQDRFLGVKAPKADFLKEIVVGISPALLPKKDKVNPQTSEQVQNAAAFSQATGNTNTVVNTTIEVQKAQAPVAAPASATPPPSVEPSIASDESEKIAESNSSESALPQKPVSSFDFLDVGVGTSPSAPKTKSFLAHFAKKDKVDKDKDK